MKVRQHQVDAFATRLGIPEDPVTSSAHCTLAPYWAARLGKHRLSARQVSRRGGRIMCELKGDRVLLSGSAAFTEAEMDAPAVTPAEGGPGRSSVL